MKQFFKMFIKSLYIVISYWAMCLLFGIVLFPIIDMIPYLNKYSDAHKIFYGTMLCYLFVEIINERSRISKG